MYVSLSENRREVAHLMMQLRAEYEAGNRIIDKGKLPQDIQNYLMNRCIENMEHCKQELTTLVGIEQTNAMLAELGL
jgi:hypothetical protein